MPDLTLHDFATPFDSFTTAASGSILFHDFNGQAVVVSDPPEITGVSPTVSTDISPNQQLQYDITDDGAFLLNLVVADLADGSYEVVHDGTGFAPAYSSSTRSVITDGYRYQITRNAGWPVLPFPTPSPVIIRHWSVDTQGQENT